MTFPGHNTISTELARLSTVARGFLQAATKPALILTMGSIIGVLDDLQVRYLRVDRFGNGMEIAYQALFLAAAAATAFFVLRKRSWSVGRKLSTLIMTIPVATIGDNVSIDAGTLKPYFMTIPPEGFIWRQDVFGHTIGLSQLAVWVNEQTFAAGLINGYVAAVAIAAVYMVLQYAWSRRTLP